MRKIIYSGILFLIIACQQTESTTQTEIPLTNTPPVPPQLDTPTPAVTLPPTLTPTPIPYYFKDEFNIDLNAWVSFQTGGESSPDIRLENDLLRIDFSTPETWYSLIHTTHEYERVFINAAIYANSSASIGLICNYSENGWLEYNLTSAGTYAVLFGQMLGDGIAHYTPVESDSSEYLKPNTLEYEIGLTCADGFILLHVNEKLFRKIDVSRFELKSGKIGLSFSSYESTPLISTVNWIQVREP